MSPFFELAFAKGWQWVWVGLTCGFAAKYALLIKRGVPVRPWLVFADLMLLPMVGLIAYWVASRAGAEAEARALVTAFCAVAADRLIKLLTDRFLMRVDSEAEALANEVLGKARNAVAGEQAAKRIIDDTIEGRAPEEYAVLKPRATARKKD